MARIIITGNSVSTVSSLKLDDIKTVAKYRPQALILTEGEGNDVHAVFRITTGTSGCMSANGISFTAETSDGSAVVTEIFAGVSEKEIKDEVAEKYGVGILYLNKMEEIIPGILDDIKAMRTEIKSSIEVQ